MAEVLFFQKQEAAKTGRNASAESAGRRDTVSFVHCLKLGRFRCPVVFCTLVNVLIFRIVQALLLFVWSVLLGGVLCMCFLIGVATALVLLAELRSSSAVAQTGLTDQNEVVASSS